MRHLNRQFASDKLPLLFQETPDRMTASSPKGESHNNNSFLHLRVPPLAERLKSTLTEVRPCSSVLHLPSLSVFDFVPFDSAASLTLSCVYPLPFARYFKVRPRPTVPTAARLRFHLSEIDFRSGKSMPGWIIVISAPDRRGDHPPHRHQHVRGVTLSTTACCSQVDDYPRGPLS